MTKETKEPENTKHDCEHNWALYDQQDDPGNMIEWHWDMAGDYRASIRVTLLLLCRKCGAGAVSRNQVAKIKIDDEDIDLSFCEGFDPSSYFGPQ